MVARKGSHPPAEDLPPSTPSLAASSCRRGQTASNSSQRGGRTTVPLSGPEVKRRSTLRPTG
eukprot:5705655-Pyramimonas_sp.AAC.1